MEKRNALLKNEIISLVNTALKAVLPKNQNIQDSYVKSRSLSVFLVLTKSSFPTISKEQQFAEKIHAYTLPRKEGVTNSRVKDLVDMVLLISTGELQTNRFAVAIKATFERRATHIFSSTLLPPPNSWSGPFAALAEDCGISVDIGSAFQVTQNFINQL